MKQNEEKINLAQFYDTLPKPRPIIACVTPIWDIGEPTVKGTCKNRPTP